MRDVVLYATDTMADWEYGHVLGGVATAEGQAPGRFRVRVLSQDGGPVTTLGGLRVEADGGVGDADPATTAVLVLPGANTWDEGHQAALATASAMLAAGVPVAAICGATMGLARAGLLDERDHTSNAPEFLAATGYAGADRYIEARAVADDGVITAPAAMPVDFAAEVFRAIGLFPEPVIDAWYGLFTTNERRYFDALQGGHA